jgi:dihydropteroate synthase
MAKQPQSIYCGNAQFNWGERTYIMGILNITPDSFSGDGIKNNGEEAVAQAKRLAAKGADIIDIGGESTRPDSAPISQDEEIRRIVPVIERLSGELSIPISIDTYKAEVARRAIAAGAKMINDIWGLKQDPEIAQVAAESGVPLIISSNQRGKPSRNIVNEVISCLKKSIDLAKGYGVPKDNIIIDPGFGFGKTLEQNLELLSRLEELKDLGRPILLGTSRKSMIGLVLDLPINERVFGTAATVAIGIRNGVDIVRVHDVEEMVQVCRMSDAIIRENKYVR